MTKIKIKDIYRLILKTLPISPDGNLLVDIEAGKKITLYPSKKEGSVNKTAGIIKTKTNGVKVENRLRKQETKRLKRELAK